MQWIIAGILAGYLLMFAAGLHLGRARRLDRLERLGQLQDGLDAAAWVHEQRPLPRAAVFETGPMHELTWSEISAGFDRTEREIARLQAEAEDRLGRIEPL
jgi:hypothetical protein